MHGKYNMNYKLYTLVDITHTGQYRAEIGKESARWKEQNFNTIIQKLGIRSNIMFLNSPIITETKGRLVGFDTDEIIRVWRFDFESERDGVYEKDGDPIGFLKDDFELVPYINGLDELLEQKYAVFVTDGPGKNIVFSKIL
jgi:predicted ribosome-associated RNA-binding protein Tma20